MNHRADNAIVPFVLEPAAFIDGGVSEVRLSDDYSGDSARRHVHNFVKNTGLTNTVNNNFQMTWQPGVLPNSQR
jgi:hypothetical protein